MRGRRSVRSVLALGALLVLLDASTAWAHTGATRPAPTAAPTPKKPPEGPRGRLEVRAPRGEALRLRALEGSLLGAEIEIANVGEGPLTIEGIGFLPGAPGAPRTPPGASVGIGKGREAKLAPGETRKVDVRWRAELARAAELTGFVEIRSDSAAPGAQAFDAPAIVGVLADRRAGLGRVLASAIVLLPLLVVLLAAASRRLPALGERALARASTGVFAVHAALSILATAWLDPRLAGPDGNDGFQYLEHARLPLGLSWTVGLDGLAAPSLVSASLVLLGAAVAGRRVKLHAAPFFSGLALLAVSTAGTILALDLRLLVAFAALGAPAAYLLASASSAPEARRSALGLAAVFAASAATLAAAAFGLARAAGPGLDLAVGLADATWSITELARADVGAGTRIAGLHPAVAAWALPVVALALRAGMALPLTARGLRYAPAPARVAVIGTSLIGLGVVVLRLGLGPGATAAASVAPALGAAGVAIAAIGVLSVMRARDLEEVASSVVAVGGGLALAGLSSRSPQGIEGALALLSWHGVAAALLALVGGSIADRVGGSDLARLGGLRADMPRASALGGLALLGAAGLPGLATFWGLSLGVAGLGARAPWLALACVAILIAQGVALARVHARTFHGPLSPDWKDEKALEPFGGRFPDLRARELLGMLPLAAALLVLGLHPRALLAAAEARVLELHRRVDPAGPTQIASRDAPRAGASAARG